MSEQIPLIMDFTGVYRDDPFFMQHDFRWLDCRDLRGTSCYCDEEAVKQLRERMAAYSPCGIHLIDSGNYHYVSKLWTDRLERPFSLVLFDHHPDMQPSLFEELLSCGCWVRKMLDENRYLRKVCIVGAAESLKKETEGYGERLLFYSEQTLEHEEAWRLFSDFHLLGDVYVSVDKDVLSPEYAATNWNQGSMTLEQLKRLLAVVLSNNRVIGMDICGELNAVAHDWQYACGERLNGNTNEALLRFLKEMLQSRGNEKRMA